MVNDLQFCTPEEAGVSSRAILKFIKRVEEWKVNLHSFMFVRNGKILAEGYYPPFNAETPHRLYSSSKTYVSLAIGKLIGEGKLSLTDRLVDLFPEYIDREQHKWMQECTVEDALKMSVPMLSDTYYDRAYKEWAWTFFNRQEALKPAGSIYWYNTSGTFILGVLVEKLTGKTFVEYLRPEFDKIGVSKDIWCVKSPDGYAWGGSGVISTLRDYAKVGELLMHKGEYKGEQLLPREYMERATSKQISNLYENDYSLRSTCGYGYQVWITDHGFSMYGMGTQYVFCFPDKDFMFVCQGDTQCNSDRCGDFVYMWARDVYEELSDAPLQEDKEGYQALQDKLSSLQLATMGEAHSAFEKEVSGATYELQENGMGWKWFRFDFEGDEGTLTYENPRGVKKIAFALGGYKEGTFPETNFYGEQVDTPSNREFQCMASAGWTEETKLLLRVYITDSSLGHCFMTFGFKGKEVGLSLFKRAEFFMDGYQGFAGGWRTEK